MEKALASGDLQLFNKTLDEMVIDTKTLEQELKKLGLPPELINNLKAAGVNTGDLVLQAMKGENAAKVLEASLNNVANKSMSMSASLTHLASVLGQVSMAINGIKNLGSI